MSGTFQIKDAACAKCTFCSVGTDAACSSGTAGVGKRAKAT